MTWTRKYTSGFAVRVTGVVVNTRIVMAGTKAIVTKFARHRMERYGGHITITKMFTKSLLRRMGFVKRKGTKGVKHLLNDFNEISRQFKDKIEKVAYENNVRDSLIINWDQTGCQFVPEGDWTMDEEGSLQITISGLDDKKKQITLLLAIAKVGTLLPPQLIYPGKTERCLPRGVDFPNDWDVTFTESHWSTEETMIPIVKNIIIQYVEEVRESLPLSRENQKTIAIFDVYKAHQGEKLLDLLKQNNIVLLCVPAACTDRLQPLDLSVNREYKEELRSHFHNWYSSDVIKQISKQEDNGEPVNDNVVVNVKTSLLKPVHAKLIISTHTKMKTRKDLIQLGFRKAGLL